MSTLVRELAYTPENNEEEEEEERGVS